MQFAKGTGSLFNDYLNHFLNSLTNNEHNKYLESQNKSDQKTSETTTANADDNSKVADKELVCDKDETNLSKENGPIVNGDQPSSIKHNNSDEAETTAEPTNEDTIKM